VKLMRSIIIRFAPFHGRIARKIVLKVKLVAPQAGGAERKMKTARDSIAQVIKPVFILRKGNSDYVGETIASKQMEISHCPISGSGCAGTRQEFSEHPGSESGVDNRISDD